MNLKLCDLKAQRYPCVSPVSPLHLPSISLYLPGAHRHARQDLPCISPASPLHLSSSPSISKARIATRADISPVSPLHLPSISPLSPSISKARIATRAEESAERNGRALNGSQLPLVEANRDYPNPNPNPSPSPNPKPNPKPNTNEANRHYETPLHFAEHFYADMQASIFSLISPLYLPYISPISPLYLPYISPISPSYLPYISLIPPLKIHVQPATASRAIVSRVVVVRPQ